jgi:hypothetical protein
MCMSCGCGNIHDDHGDPNHITVERLQQAADAAGIDVQDAARNISEASEAAGSTN